MISLSLIFLILVLMVHLSKAIEQCTANVRSKGSNPAIELENRIKEAGGHRRDLAGLPGDAKGNDELRPADQDDQPPVQHSADPPATAPLHHPKLVVIRRLTVLGQIRICKKRTTPTAVWQKLRTRLAETKAQLADSTELLQSLLCQIDLHRDELAQRAGFLNNQQIANEILQHVVNQTPRDAGNAGQPDRPIMRSTDTEADPQQEAPPPGLPSPPNSAPGSPINHPAQPPPPPPPPRPDSPPPPLRRGRPLEGIRRNAARFAVAEDCYLIVARTSPLARHFPGLAASFRRIVHAATFRHRRTMSDPMDIDLPGELMADGDMTVLMDVDSPRLNNNYDPTDNIE